MYIRRRSGIDLAWCLLFALCAAVWLAGGASRADVLGQVVVRAFAWLALIIAILFMDRPPLRQFGAVGFLFSATIVLLVIQMIPLPPALWQALPARAVLTGAVEGDQPWRPWSIVPGGTLNALGSLVVPAATMLLVVGLGGRGRRSLPPILLALMTASAVLGVLQFGGVRFDNPLVNEGLGGVSGTFANRNHFALFLACGCLLAPAWAFQGGRAPGWRVLVVIGLMLLFVLMILASGSRAGLIVGTVGAMTGWAIVWNDVRRSLRGTPRWVPFASMAGIVVLLTIAVLASIAAGRAESIARVFSVDSSQDIRNRAVSTMLRMVGEYFPLGSGFGTFDPVFRMHEPFDLLKPTYFNHAHDDFLEVALEGGLPGITLLLAALGWLGRATIRAIGGGRSALFARVGAGMLWLIAIASIFDYPARTPIVMMTIVIAALWAQGTKPEPRSALPVADD